ncbi:hypothetical protein P4O66_013232 [Electrophorus voltai]|uniref:Uncharacterized protein n=1 Tax=Electrophorus voltai TaxID=2609070 RepID=A0AAD8Z2C1_9TELE|nr:hypothetical protein P4O66_013232 [Electrophorus voltai]
MSVSFPHHTSCLKLNVLHHDREHGLPGQSSTHTSAAPWAEDALESCTSTALLDLKRPAELSGKKKTPGQEVSPTFHCHVGRVDARRCIIEGVVSCCGCMPPYATVLAVHTLPMQTDSIIYKASGKRTTQTAATMTSILASLKCVWLWAFVWVTFIDNHSSLKASLHPVPNNINSFKSRLSAGISCATHESDVTVTVIGKQKQMQSNQNVSYIFKYKDVEGNAHANWRVTEDVRRTADPPEEKRTRWYEGVSGKIGTG